MEYWATFLRPRRYNSYGGDAWPLMMEAMLVSAAAGGTRGMIAVTPLYLARRFIIAHALYIRFIGLSRSRLLDSEMATPAALFAAAGWTTRASARPHALRFISRALTSSRYANRVYVIASLPRARLFEDWMLIQLAKNRYNIYATRTSFIFAWFADASPLALAAPITWSSLLSRLSNFICHFNAIVI